MMRTLRYVFLALVALVLLTVALANRDLVHLSALPADLAAFLGVDWQIDLPLYLVFFGGIVMGLLIGFVWEWFREMKHRSAAVRGSRHVAELERELAVLRDASSLPKDDVLAILEAPRGR